MDTPQMLRRMAERLRHKAQGQPSNLLRFQFEQLAQAYDNVADITRIAQHSCSPSSNAPDADGEEPVGTLDGAIDLLPWQH